jgi:hypothetical protein
MLKWLIVLFAAVFVVGLLQPRMARLHAAGPPAGRHPLPPARPGIFLSLRLGGGVFA